MTKEEFIKNASLLGYCTKAQAIKFCKNGKENYTEEDYIAVFRFAETYQHKNKGRPLLTGGYTSKIYTN